jgi:hypothetical protein
MLLSREKAKLKTFLDRPLKKEEVILSPPLGNLCVYFCVPQSTSVYSFSFKRKIWSPSSQAIEFDFLQFNQFFF